MVLLMQTKNWYSLTMEGAPQEGLCTEEYEVLLTKKGGTIHCQLRKSKEQG